MSKTMASAAEVFCKQPIPKLTVHIIDPSPANRANLSRSCLAAGYHAEIYEDYTEYASEAGPTGIILASEDAVEGGIPGLFERLEKLHLKIPVIGLGKKPSTKTIVAAMQAGAMAYIDCNEIADLGALVGKATENYERRTAHALKVRAAKIAIESLTVRESEVIELIAQGNTGREIGALLGISTRTVEIHRHNILKKIGARNVAQVVSIHAHASLI
ncbi:response regulator transcription factor [Croceicoccus gelatinilyticus]|uniref:response regulator transcription factor n=1 Tax=Croceicoccus gelatinilyticus TaxID=2835536 RepID=UPI001BD0DCE0|nr:LuxR C-terminal-related transcriptional regulator [Croceicoccus gelatinilyticus]MBS7671764.1 hypothetical protein [Croceicoccus gelatinilyticus]